MDKYAPTFWTQKRLDRVKTRVSTGPGAYKDGEQWTLHQSSPDNNDATRAGLWLGSIAKQGNGINERWIGRGI